jgi:hypothetical protein
MHLANNLHLDKLLLKNAYLAMDMYFMKDIMRRNYRE